MAGFYYVTKLEKKCRTSIGDDLWLGDDRH